MSLFSGGKLVISLKRRTLSWTISGEAPRRFRLKPGVFSVGRIQPNDLVIAHESVSRRHARLILEGDGLSVEDIASTQGTWISNQRLKPYSRTPIPPDSSLWMGQVELKYEPVQVIQIPLLWIASVAGTILLLAAFLAWFSNRPPRSVSFTCAAPSYLISLSDVSVPPPPQEPQPSPILPTPGSITGTQETQIPETATPSPFLPPGIAVSDPHQFIDLPFPYNGTGECGPGTDEQFQRASDRSERGGRINSFFDHKSPIYKREDPSDQGKMLLFTGELSESDDYSGHPAYDFSTSEYNKPTTPACAAAPGVIEQVFIDEKSLDNHVIKIRHHVEGVGDFVTLYFHLNPDQYFDDTKNRVGQTVERYERIGTIGNTGFSTGFHLHFEVQIEADGRTRVVDPYGYIPSTKYPQDPWVVDSPYLWIHAYPQTEFTFPPDVGEEPAKSKSVGGEELAQVLSTYPHLCSPPDAVPSGGKLFFSISLSPPAAQGLVSLAKAITFALQDGQGNAISQFDQPIQVSIPYTPEDLANVDPTTLQIRRLNEQQNVWEYVNTLFDYGNHIAGSQVTQPGQYALFGQLTVDQIPPITTITAQGLKDPQGAWCDAVTVTITSQDEQSSITEFQYRLRNELPWVIGEYSPVTYTLQPEGVPDEVQIPESGVGDVYPSGNGRYLVQAIAKDSLGNMDVRPSFLYITIDPSINRSRCVDTTLSSANSKQ